MLPQGQFFTIKIFLYTLILYRTNICILCTNIYIQHIGEVFQGHLTNSSRDQKGQKHPLEKKSKYWYKTLGGLTAPLPIVKKKFLYFLWIFQRAGHLKKGGHKFLRIWGTKAPLNLGHGLKLPNTNFCFGELTIKIFLQGILQIFL